MPPPPLPNDFVRVYSLRCSLSHHPFSLIINVYDHYHVLSCSCNVDDDYIVSCVSSEVSLFIHCTTAPIAHCHPQPLFCPNIIWGVADSGFCSFSLWLLQKHHILLPFHPCLQHGHGSYVWSGPVVLDRFNHWATVTPIPLFISMMDPAACTVHVADEAGVASVVGVVLSTIVTSSASAPPFLCIGHLLFAPATVPSFGCRCPPAERCAVCYSGRSCGLCRPSCWSSSPPLQCPPGGLRLLCAWTAECDVISIEVSALH